MVYNFEWPDGFLDVMRVEGRDKVLFAGFVTVENGDEIPAYEFGVQALYVLKASSNRKDYLANATVNNPGQKGNSATIHVYRITEDGRIEQVDYPYEVPIKVHFDGEGS